MTVSLVILVGKVKIVIYDSKFDIFDKFIINESKPQMLVIPPKNILELKIYLSKKVCY